MQCPIDQTTLAITERQGIEIDYCPQCRGVWLDRGELDKLIDVSSSSAGFTSRDPQREPPRPDDRSYDRGRNIHDSDDPSYKHGHKRKKGGFLGELFDF